jgi:hypothetical protein
VREDGRCSWAGGGAPPPRRGGGLVGRLGGVAAPVLALQFLLDPRQVLTLVRQGRFNRRQRAALIHHYFIG